MSRNSLSRAREDERPAVGNDRFPRRRGGGIHVVLAATQHVLRSISVRINIVAVEASEPARRARNNAPSLGRSTSSSRHASSIPERDSFNDKLFFRLLRSRLGYALAIPDRRVADFRLTCAHPLFLVYYAFMALGAKTVVLRTLCARIMSLFLPCKNQFRTMHAR